MSTEATGAVPLSRGHKKRERTRRQLIEAGLQVLARKGEALTVTDVVSAAGVSNGTFYNYFVDREALFDVLAEHLISAFTDQAAAEIEGEDPALRFATATARVLTRARAEPDWGRVILRLRSLREEAQEQALRHLRADLDACRRAGRFEVGADEATLDLVGGALLMSVARIVAGRAGDDYLQDILCRTLRALGLSAQEAPEVAASALADAREAG